MSTNTAPFTVIPRLTQIAMAIKPMGLVADIVCPRIPVEAEKFNYTKMTTEEAFNVPDTRIGRTSEANQVEFGGVDVTDSTEDYALDDSIPNKDIKTAEGTNYDPEAMAVERTTILMDLAREQRVANLLFSLNTYSAALRSTLAGASQWSDVTSDPVAAILARFDLMLVRPNFALLGQQVWTALRQHPKVVAAVQNAGGAGAGQASQGVVARRAVADLLELEDIVVGQSFINSAKKGQAASYARVWGKHAAFMRLEKSVKDPRGALPTFCFTAQFGTRQSGYFEEPKRGIYGSRTIRVAEQVKELVSFQEVGCFFQNAVA